MIFLGDDFFLELGVLDGLAGSTLLRQKVQNSDGVIFEKLGAGDVLGDD